MSFRTRAVQWSAPVLALSLALSGCGGGGSAGGTTSPASTLTPPTAPALTVPTFSKTDAPPKDSPPPVAFPQVSPPDTGIKQDAAKYPQDTPDKALESIAKSIEGKDLAYQVSWLMTPDHAVRLMEKYKTIDAVVAANQGEDRVKGRQALLETIREMQAAKKTVEGETLTVKWTCFKLDDGKAIQLELQKDGRWCMNPKIHSAPTVGK